MTKLIKDNGRLRQCSKCHKWKIRSEQTFVKRKACKHGLAGTCRECFNKQVREWKRKNSKRLAKRRRELYYKKEKVIEATRERERWRKNPIKKRAQILRNSMQQNARIRKRKFDNKYFTLFRITKMLETQPYCECCGVKFRMRKSFTGYFYNNSPSFDRIDSNKSYIKGNVALICWRCNNLKRDATINELETVVKWMRKKAKQKGKTNG